MSSEDFNPSNLNGRQRRLLAEWKSMEALAHSNLLPECELRTVRCNEIGLPIVYHITYPIYSICGVDNDNNDSPMFADRFEMIVELPRNYPDYDAPPSFRFLVEDEDGNSISHPWHPNIRYNGVTAGRVCLNHVDTYSSIASAVIRIAEYLTYDRYHALAIPPYPEDLTVARWVTEKAEPLGWIPFNQN